ncbi:2-succinyl-5-enolpyruvyl-6-hydroxy-3-cyclohexene-1-carboxylic-acid synthase [Streptomyces sp. NP160]|uniref:2-succinyl-5-enolpyruvyl-6-hydroxy-3- cyclohexene-1-carboxylic-acid synthase n=1 Tax=Streptomyces sp. NP160 TaxID=2586637 RepID=UPI0011184871|nr:2-succinyl-5-enolpyruvyl-6-hydroxy-3-cyclohexene-1-carboxylic-acid synthase [Streptomyces sp. NP160]TNM69926.1 2-succinyl-5-enolpyruvyl-6-hydroxy-3-cyclohexene-1-carboxylic-acid synthase [Streptomyces sp. NP160]
MPSPSAPSDEQPSTQPSTLLARVVVLALAQAGVREVVLCPGSRSAPLAYALHDADAAGLLRLHVRHDERAAAFTALGVGRATGLPAAVVTTSGTAVANLHPAVLEAAESAVPLLVLSADRPHGVRGTWANQTTALQAGLFGAAARLALDLPVPGPREPLARARATWAAGVADLVAAARGERGGRPGPVHGDLAFADPLVPDVPWTPPALPALPAGSAPAAPSSALPAGSADEELAGGPERTVVVAGDGPPALGALARALAERCAWPLLAEPSSGARSGPGAVAAYRLLLDLPDLGGAVERVVAVGRPTLSRPVSALLARADVELVQLVAHPDDPGPGSGRRHRRVLVPPDQRDEHGDDGGGAAPTAWLRRWQRAGLAAQAVLDAVLDDEARAGRLTGPLLAREVAAAARPGELLVTAASNAVRDLDLAAAPWTVPASAPLVLAGRGLSGIDGTLSTAVGAALGAGAPTTALVGDLAALHDANGLLLPPGEPAPDLRVVVLDDDGGGIFTGLEHGDPAHPDRSRVFERLFGTPHGRDLVALVGALGVPARRVTDLAGLRAALAAPVRGCEVLVVPADRSGLRDLHARIRGRVRSATSGG